MIIKTPGNIQIYKITTKLDDFDMIIKRKHDSTREKKLPVAECLRKNEKLKKSIYFKGDGFDKETVLGLETRCSVRLVNLALTNIELQILANRGTRIQLLCIIHYYYYKWLYNPVVGR
jgi:hypothetical protein